MWFRRYLRYILVWRDTQKNIYLMLAMGFFMGVFVAAYTVTAESLFLSSLSHRLDQAFLVSGVLGIATAFIFSYLQNKIRYSTLTLMTLLLIMISSLVINQFYQFAEESVKSSFLFLMYCLIGPFTLLIQLCFWGVFARLFNFRQSKKIVGWIDTGQLIAIILTNFLIPVISSLFVYFRDTSHFLLICEISLVGVLLILLLIFSKSNLSDTVMTNQHNVKRRSPGVKYYIKDSYVTLLSLFSVISLMTFLFTQFSFQTVLNRQYPDQNELTNFLGYFNGTIYAFSLIMQTYVNNRITDNYGIRVSLMILPLLIGILSLVAIVFPPIYGVFIVDEENTFLFFFILIALLRLSNSVVHESLESPIFKLLFIPLSYRWRYDIQAKVEGVVGQLGRFLGGLIIFSLALIPFFKLFWVLILLVILSFIYGMVANSLYNGYRNKIKKRLNSVLRDKEQLNFGLSHFTDRLKAYLVESYWSRAIFSFRLLERIYPSLGVEWLNQLMKNKAEYANQYATMRLSEYKGLTVSERYVIKTSANTKEKKIINKGDLKKLFSYGGDIIDDRILKLARSQDVGDRQYAAELILHANSESSSFFLIELLNDPEEKVKRTAMMIASSKYNKEVIYTLVDYLNNYTYSSQVMNTLTRIGQDALPILENCFYRSGQLPQTMVRIVQVIGRIGGEEAQTFLWKKINYPNKILVSEILQALGNHGFKATDIHQTNPVRFSIESDISDISWNLNALMEISNFIEAQPLRQALMWEIQNDTEHIYMLLGMLYDNASIQMVKKNMEGGTPESRTYAVELLGILLPEQLKVKIIPVLDNIPNAEKVDKLQTLYPRVRFDSDLTLKFIINRDFTQANRWTKTCAIHLVGTSKNREFEMDVCAHLFNPDKMIREVAAWALFQTDPSLYYQHVVRLPAHTREELDSVILKSESKIENQPWLKIYNKVIFFMRIPMLSKIDGLTLAILAEFSEEISLHENEMFITDRIHDMFFVVYSGQVQYVKRESITESFYEEQFIGEMISPVSADEHNFIVAKQDSIVLGFNKDQFYELLADKITLANKVIDFV